MAKRRRKGLGDSSTSAAGWLTSATRNLSRMRGQKNSGCSSIEHYTDVVAEATVAAVLAPKGSAISTRADNVVREATAAQRVATQACKLHHSKRSSAR